jgi:hypothetical protein
MRIYFYDFVNSYNKYKNYTYWKMEYSKMICDFSLIFIIYLFLALPNYTAEFSRSILGRTLAVLLIAYYTYNDILYGLMFCLIVIFYYQLEPDVYGVEGFEWEYQLDAGKTDDFYKYPAEKYSRSETINATPSPDSPSDGFVKVVKRCDAANASCTFDIIDLRLKNENEIVFPKNSNDWIDTIFARMQK